MNKRCERCDAVLGETDANYCVRCSADASETTNSGSAELAPDVAALHVHWPGGSRVHPLTAPLMTLGRDDSNDIVVDYPTVSRFHAEIHRTDDGFLLVDTDSLSGLRIHGQLVREIELSGGEHIRIGDGRGESVTLAFEAAAQPGEITAPDSPHPTDVQAGRLSLPGRGSAVLGRASDCDLYLDDLSVAGHHARVDARGDKHVLVDLGGRSGTYLNGRRVDGLTDLSNGDVIQIGRTQLSYDGSGLAPSATAGTRTLVAPFRVDYRITAPASPLLIGRDAECGIQLDHPTVSRRHARCERNEESTEACIITDLGSTNGTYVNGGRLRELTRHVLHRGDVVRIGPHKLTLRDGRLRTLSKADGMAIDAVGLTRIVRGEKGQPETILDAVEIVVEPNELVALAGGSGSGKTTLLDALCAFRQSDEGYVRVDGQDLYREKESLRPFIGYVPQSDIVHDSLTTEQALEYVARLRLDLIAEERCVQITHVLGAVDLDERRTTRIDRLSGGQRKRLSTAVELLAEPKLLFLDEPTSGLDPGLDKSMMYTFRRLADEGRTVLLVTHATANIRQCDFVLFLAPGGRLAYFGPPDEALLYFGERDFADIYTRLRNEPIEWDDKYKGSSDYRKYILNRRAEPRITPRSKNKDAPRPWRFLLRQFLVLTQRYLAILRSDKRNLAILLGQAPIIALILFILAKDGILEAYQPDVGGASGAAFEGAMSHASGAQTILHVMASVAVWFGLLNSAREITKESAVYGRERMAGVGIAPYVLSKVAVLVLVCLLQSAVLLSVTLQTGVPVDAIVFGPRADLLLTLFLTNVAGMAMGLLVSSRVSNEDRAMSIVPLVLIPQLLLGGVLFSIPERTRWLMWMTMTYWATHGLGSIANVCGAFQDGLCPEERFNLGYDPSVRAVLSDWFVLLACVVLLLAATAFSLKWKERGS